MVSSLDHQLLERDQLLDELKKYLQRAQQKMKAAADQQRRVVEFANGELVYLRMRRYRLKSLAQCLNEKLAPRYNGPL